MTNLPKSLREKLRELYPLASAHIVDKMESADGTIKYVIEYGDGKSVEAVAINDGSEDSEACRLTLCVSTQVGCPIGCKFCATGHQGYTRNLTADEIIEQLILISNDLDERVDNVVIMGQGEPFMNYGEVLDAMRRMNQDKGIEIGARRITVSTSGLIDQILDFANEPEQFRLAVSLHSADQETRDKIMPGLKRQPLHQLRRALNKYDEIKGRRVTIEYMLLKDVNDSDEDLQKLIDFCSGFKAHVNLLDYNKVEGSKFKNVSRETFSKWKNELSSAGIATSVRKSKGSDIAGACGQLVLNKTV